MGPSKPWGLCESHRNFPGFKGVMQPMRGEWLEEWCETYGLCSVSRLGIRNMFFHTHKLLRRCDFPPSGSWPLKTGYFEGPTPAMQVQTLPVEGQMILRAGLICEMIVQLVKLPQPFQQTYKHGSCKCSYHPWKRRSIYKSAIFGFHVGLWGCRWFISMTFWEGETIHHFSQSSGTIEVGKDVFFFLDQIHPLTQSNHKTIRLLVEP